METEKDKAKDDKKPAADNHGHGNSDTKVLKRLAFGGLGFMAMALCFKIGMGFAAEGGMSWAQGKDNLISAAVAAGVAGLIFLLLSKD